MKKIIIIFFLFFSCSFLAAIFPTSVRAQGLGEKLAGRILLNVEGKGEAWYVYPEDNKRYYLGRPTDAFAVMRELGLGISELDFQKIAQADMPVAGDLVLAKRLSGRIILQAERNGEAWYINPLNLKKYYLGRPADAFRIMRDLSLGISREDLAGVHKSSYNESFNGYSKYEHKKIISTLGGDFAVDVVEIDLADPNLEIITDTADDDDCESNCQAKSLAKFVIANNGFAGINATYFCSDNGCGAAYYYFFPVFNSRSGKLINEDQLKYWTTGPIMAFDANNKFYYFKDSREFGGVDIFEKKYGVKLQAAIGNKPRLIENGLNLLIDWEVDEKQLKTKALRNALAYKGGKIYLVVARQATLPELAQIMEAMEVEYALNLDGGNSSALFYNDEYMIGPGRDIPNAIIFKEKLKYY
ncbi:MAG: phosphodiester glycosidase family protein [Patescibacteria group bacterium]|nr:phosphodiester glycosidase family protein [Patescibacteria group bacterium]